MATVMVMQADAARLPLADRSVDIVFGSPSYTDCRTYDDGTLPPGHVVSRRTVEWVEWMLDITVEGLRVSRGPVLWVIGCPTRGRNYQPAAEGLAWEAFRLGIHAYRPCYWKRVGIPGSGGKDWFRADIEYVLAFKHSGPLPWSDNTAMGHPPKWAPGGEMSYRLSDGTRVNEWGKPGHSTGRLANGKRKPRGAQAVTKGTMWEYRQPGYTPPKLANPGNLVKTNVGGGQLGDKLAHENEAPFPEALAEFFIRSLCPPGGTVLDPFSGSGTTAKVAKVLGRNAIASDIRTSQVALTERRVGIVQTQLFAEAT